MQVNDKMVGALTAEQVADHIGVTPYSDMRPFVVQAVKYAREKDAALATVNVEPVDFANGPVMAQLSYGKFLTWIADRMVHVHGENPNYDYILRLREIASWLAARSALVEGGEAEAARIGDAVLDWMVRYDLLDGGNEYRASDVIAVLNDLATATPAPADERVVEAQIECHGLDTPERVCFYEQDFYVLSNFSSFNVIWAGQWKFPTSEHCYHWLKFATGFDLLDAAGVDAEPIAREILSAPSAHEAFKIAERNKDLRRPDWDEVKVGFMRKILEAKAKQHEYVRRKLLATGDRELVENSWRDDFWGWGPNRDGKNMLGKLWMEVRAALKAQ